MALLGDSWVVLSRFFLGSDFSSNVFPAAPQLVAAAPGQQAT